MGKTAVTWTDARLDDLADVLAPLPAEVAMLKATVNHWDHLPLHLNPCPLASLCWLPPLNAWRRRTALFAQNSRRRSANFSRSPGVSWWRSSAPQPHSFPHWCDERTAPRPVARLCGERCNDPGRPATLPHFALPAHP
jgi:hypothetical protein